MNIFLPFHAGNYTLTFTGAATANEVIAISFR